MRKSKQLVIGLLLVWSSVGFAFNTASIWGTILDSTTNRPLPNVNVYLQNTAIGCVSDSAGHFELTNLADGTHQLVFQRVGYKKVKKKITLSPPRQINLTIKMETDIVNAEDIIVEDTRWRSPFFDFFQGEHRLTRKQIADQPGAFEDPLRSLQIITGVVNQSDFTTNMYIRGSKPDEQAIILDGVLLQNPYRLRLAGYGGISIINPDIVNYLRISLGGFPANYGLRSGGLVEIQTFDGNQSWTNRLSLNLVSTRYFLSGPLWHNAKLIFSTRRTYYDILLKKLGALQTNYPFFTDTFGKLVWQADPKLTLRAAVLFGNEGSDMTNNQFFSGRIFSRSKNLIAYINFAGFLNEHLNYRISLARQTNADSLNASSSMVDYYRSYRIHSNRSSFHSQIEWEVDPKFSVAFGADFFSVQQKWARAETKPLFSYQGKSIFVNEHLRIKKNLRLKLGLRLDYSTINRKITYDPRFSFDWKISTISNLGFAYGIYHRLPQKFSFNNHELPSIPDSLLSRFRSPYLTYLGFKWEITPFKNLSVRLEGYLKKGVHLPGYLTDNTSKPIINDNGQDFSRGIEINIKYTADKWETHVGYVYSMALQKGIGASDWQYKEFDTRHWFSWFFIYQFKRHFKLRSLLRASSGFPIQENIGWYKSGEQSWDLIPGFTYKRYPYFRWDLRLSYQLNHWSFFLETLNVTNHKNFYQELYSFHCNDNRTTLKRYVTYMLPRLPVLGLAFEF